MSIEIVVDKYSTAIFELAQEHAKVEVVERDLIYVQQVIREHPELAKLLENPVVDEKVKSETLGKIFASSIDELALNSLYVMVHRGRARYISSIIAGYITKARTARGEVEATVFVREALTEDLKVKLLNKLKAVSDKTFILNEVVNPDMVGGLILQVGDTRIDASVGRQLEEMKRTLLKAGIS